MINKITGKNFSPTYTFYSTHYMTHVLNLTGFFHFNTFIFVLNLSCSKFRLFFHKVYRRIQL